MPIEPTINHGPVVLPIARATIGREFDRHHDAPETAAWLHEPGACFVTLTQDGELRGCIGSLEAHRSLLADIKGNARAAAFADPRFAPLAVAEFASIGIEVSLLTPMEPMAFTDEADALAQLRPGVDGVVFGYGHRRSTFLPQVWEQLPDARGFMAHLKAKAGLPTGFWAPDVTLHRYAVLKYKENASMRRAAATR